MNKSELKKVLKPLIKECIKEVLLEETGVLAKVVSEVASGMGGQLLTEDHQPKKPKFLQPKRSQPIENKQAGKHLLDAIGKGAYNGVNVFEGVDPIREKAPPPGQPAQTENGPLKGLEPGDPGVDLSHFFGA